MIKNYWYAVANSEQISKKPLGVRRFGLNLVLWRDSQGSIHCFEDRCPHRGTKLSLGHVVKDELQCAYHGFRYDGTGQCRLIPAIGADGKIPPNMRTRSFPVFENRGLVHLWWGEAAPIDKALPWFEDFDDRGFTYIDTYMESPVSFGRMMESNLDFAHFPFVHPNYFTAVGNMAYAKNFKTVVNGDRIDFSGKFCGDTEKAHHDDSGVPVMGACLFPNMAMYPSPLDPHGNRVVAWICPVSERECWFNLRVYLAPGPFLFLKRLVQKHIILKVLWQKWVYRQDQRVMIPQAPGESGVDADILPCPSDSPIAHYLRMYREALRKDQPESRKSIPA